MIFDRGGRWGIPICSGDELFPRQFKVNGVLISSFEIRCNENNPEEREREFLNDLHRCFEERFVAVCGVDWFNCRKSDDAPSMKSNEKSLIRYGISEEAYLVALAGLLLAMNHRECSTNICFRSVVANRVNRRGSRFLYEFAPSSTRSQGLNR